MVFEGGIRVGDGIREGKSVDDVILIIIVGRDSNGMSDGVLAGPRFKGRGFLRIGVDMDEDVDKFSLVVDGEFDGGQMEKAGAIMSNQVFVEGVVSDLSRVAQDKESVGVGVEKGGHLEESNSLHGWGKIDFEEVDGIDDFVFGEGSRGASKEAGGVIAFSGIEITENKGMDLGKVDGHVWRLKMVFWKLKVLRSERKVNF